MIITKDLKKLYATFIDDIISQHGLTNSCLLRFNNGSSDLCPNCVYDILNKCSLNQYNNTGPQPFDSGTICPVCMGMGSKKNNNKVKKVYLAVIMDSKYFMNLDSKVVNIPEGTIQTICSKDLVLDIRNANSLIIENIPNISYERIQDVNYAGLGDLNYIITNWKRQ
jgi:hypothetical protein